MATYLIKLTPLDKFFFGQKKTFGDDNVNYVVYSSFFPQQTALLGLLRYQVLQIAGEEVFKNNKIQDKEKAAKLIGKQSFNPIVEDLQFGVIESISPIFIIDNETKEYFLPVGRRFQKRDETYELLHLSCEGGYPPIFDGYEAKRGMTSCWLSSTNNTRLSEEDFFIEDERIGIRKDYKGATKDDSFFRQRYYRFNNFREVEREENGECKQPPLREHNFCFAVLLEKKDEKEIELSKLDKRIVYLGGERQPFLLEVSEETHTFAFKSTPLTSDKKYYTVVLLSDAVIEPDHLSDVKFASTEVKDFACLLTHVGTQNFYNKERKRQKQYLEESATALSLQQELYARGSVFYFEREEQAKQFCNHLKNVSSFYTVGYNHAAMFNPSSSEK